MREGFELHLLLSRRRVVHAQPNGTRPWTGPGERIRISGQVSCDDGNFVAFGKLAGNGHAGDSELCVIGVVFPQEGWLSYPAPRIVILTMLNFFGLFAAIQVYVRP